MEKTKTPGVYRRGDRYTVTWRDHEGKQRWGSARTYDDARALKRQREQEVASGEYQQQSRVRIGVYAREWIDRYQGRGSHGFRDDTRDDYRRDLERYALPYLDARLKRTVSQVTPRDIANFIAWLCNEKEQGRRLAEERRRQKAEKQGVPVADVSMPEPKPEYLADATVRRLLAPLRACFSSAVREGLIRANPCADAALPARDPQRRVDMDTDEDHDVIKLPTREQLAALLGQAPAAERLFLLFLASTGLRISEAIALRWRDVQLDGSTPHVKVRRRMVRGKFGPPKSKRSRRDVPLGHELVIALRRHHKDTEWPRPDDIVFATSVGTPHRPENLRRTIMPFAEEAAVPWLGFHALRHFFASALIDQGRNIVQVSRLLGHHSPAFTLSRYAHLMSEDAGGPLDLDAALRSSPVWPTGDRGAAQLPDTAAAVADHALRTGA